MVHSSMKLCYWCCIFFAAVTIDIEEESYNVTENEGFVKVCLVITGERERNVIFTIVSADGSATGT